MTGFIILEKDGEIISQKKFNSNTDILKHKEQWQKLYGKNYKSCEVRIIKDEGPKKMPSPFKKGGIIRGAPFAPVHKSHRGQVNTLFNEW